MHWHSYLFRLLVFSFYFFINCNKLESNSVLVDLFLSQDHLNKDLLSFSLAYMAHYILDFYVISKYDFFLVLPNLAFKVVENKYMLLKYLFTITHKLQITIYQL